MVIWLKYEDGNVVPVEADADLISRVSVVQYKGDTFVYQPSPHFCILEASFVQCAAPLLIEAGSLAEQYAIKTKQLADGTVRIAGIGV